MHSTFPTETFLFLFLSMTLLATELLLLFWVLGIRTLDDLAFRNCSTVDFCLCLSPWDRRSRCRLHFRLFVWLAIRGNVAGVVVDLANDSAKRLNIFLIPLLVWPFFLIYRLQISNLKSYLRRISEGSLVEWLGFLFLLAAACLLWKAAVQAASTGLKLFMRAGSVALFVLYDIPLH